MSRNKTIPAQQQRRPHSPQFKQLAVERSERPAGALKNNNCNKLS